MMPKMNPRQMQHMMKKMGIQQEDIDDAEQVIIRCTTREIVIDNPQVAKVNMMGQKSYQISGEAYERSRETTPEVSEDDITTVMEQAGCDKDTATKAIKEAEGDLAQAILSLQQEET